MLQEPWGGHKVVRITGTYVHSLVQPIQCKEIMVQGRNAWDDEKVQHIFSEEDARGISSLLRARTICLSVGVTMEYMKHEEQMDTHQPAYSDEAGL
ncbi:hypothetical protein V6N12_058385 [Hibiscus sabdariffa]|uniref:Uncharacterized protein n=1 Tax=Hibiscus sabdariffa TaxID=183260 RepID=A0ABR2ERZ1_9ROSI